jgi:CDP-glycerol glycerophosphotransferase
LDVSQDGHELVLDIGLRPDVRVHGFWAYCGQSNQWLPLPATSPGPLGLRAVIDMVAIANRVPADESTIVLFLDVEHDAETGSAEADRMARAPLAIVSDPRHGPDGDITHARYRLRVGHSLETRIGRLHAVKVDDRQIVAYPKRRGFLTLAMDRDVASFADVYVHRISVRGGLLKLRGRLLTRHGDVEHAELLLKARTTGVRATYPLDLAINLKRTRAKFGHRFYDFSATGDFAQLLAEGRLVDDSYDVWVTVKTAQSDEPFDVRVGRTRFLARYLTRAGSAERGGQAVVITPYYTYRARKTTLQVNLFDASTLRYLRREVRTRHLTRLRHRRRDVWLVGERPYKAQDNGYHLFKYLRETHPDLEVYYVIDRDSPERANVEPLGNVLEFGSREHIRATLLARRVLGSHHADFLYPLRTKHFRHAVRATRIFLQHGVMGTKWLVPMYGKTVGSFDTDLFVVSSEREKQYIVSDFGYDPGEVVITGLSRFDSLLAGDVAVKPRQLLVMPTWRDWLQDPDALLDSEYHARWSEFLHHPRLRALTEGRGLEVVLCLHPNMQHFRTLFADVPARVISQGEVDVQLLLKESAMLVTDFSSVGFDFSFLHKPVAYFQFDRSRFLGPQGSHLDLDEELPGTIVRSADALVAEIDLRASDGFEMLPEHVERADRFLTHRDRRSSERIYEQARTARRRRDIWKRLRAHEVTGAGLRAMRRHPFYFPVMRAMFLLLKQLPADEGLVLFESGVGRQYADSPRYLYEELVRRKSPLRKVWAYTGHLPVFDENTKVVRRLSPAYYFYLAKSKYWVNNQSFPHYVTRRTGGVYIQTWHGTPLKRMLYDLDTIHGRDSEYVDRASAAANQWSVLVSPSPYATKAICSAFRYDGAVIEQGYPRNDLFHREDRDAIGARVRRMLGIPADKKVVLYAPTFRDNQAVGNRFAFSLPFDLGRFHEAMGEDTVLLLRMHVLVRKGLRIPPELDSSVLDVSAYPEIQELFLASDVLVTDYSSVLFDFATLRRPMIFFAYDLVSYRDDLRGFYLDYETDLPGPVVTSEDTLYDALLSLDRIEKEYGGRYDAFLARFNPMDDGQAARRVVDEIFGPAVPADD